MRETRDGRQETRDKRREKRDKKTGDEERGGVVKRKEEGGQRKGMEKGDGEG